jgi:multimeric flavodoxin WrbA
MKVLAVVGSPRKGSNTDILVEAVLDGPRTNGHTVAKVSLYDLDIGPCVDCRGCKTEPHNCIVEDGMQEMYRRLEESDAVVFGTPVYWYGPSAPMKAFIDRLRPYFASGRLERKRAVLVAPAGDGPGDADLLCEMFRRTCAALDITLEGFVLGTAYDRREILQDTAAMQAARELGARL